MHKILFSSTCYEPQVLILRRKLFYTRGIWQCHSLRVFVVACRYTAWVRTDCRGKVVGGCLKTPLQSVLTQAEYRQATTNSPREWYCHMPHVYNSFFLKMSTWGSKQVEKNNTLWINNNQCIKLVIYIVNSWCTIRKTSGYLKRYTTALLISVQITSSSYN